MCFFHLKVNVCLRGSVVMVRNSDTLRDKYKDILLKRRSGSFFFFFLPNSFIVRKPNFPAIDIYLGSHYTKIIENHSILIPIYF